jgi:hypothetical protein
MNDKRREEREMRMEKRGTIQDIDVEVALGAVVVRPRKKSVVSEGLTSHVHHHITISLEQKIRS